MQRRLIGAQAFGIGPAGYRGWGCLTPRARSQYEYGGTFPIGWRPLIRSFQYEYSKMALRIRCAKANGVDDRGIGCGTAVWRWRCVPGPGTRRVRLSPDRPHELLRSTRVWNPQFSRGDNDNHTGRVRRWAD